MFQNVTVVVGSEDDCVDNCLATFGCEWYSYDPSTGFCLLTTDCDTVQECDIDCVHGQSDCYQSPGKDCKVLFLAKINLKLPLCSSWATSQVDFHNWRHIYQPGQWHNIKWIWVRGPTRWEHSVLPCSRSTSQCHSCRCYPEDKRREHSGLWRGCA